MGLLQTRIYHMERNTLNWNSVDALDLLHFFLSSGILGYSFNIFGGF